MKNPSIAIIPARGGSKRIPRKNIKSFVGKPIIAYSIESAIASQCFDEIMVSTDDSEIARISKAHGASVPFMRSTKNSGDLSITTDALKEVILEYRKLGKEFEYVCCLYPTAPFVTADKLKQAMKKLIDERAECVLTVTQFSYPIQRALRSDGGNLKMFWPENYSKRSQDLERAYHDAGQFFCARVENVLSNKLDYSAQTLPIEVPAEEVQDIDNPEDWKIAEMKYKLLKKNDS